MKLSARTLRLVLNCWPPFWGAGIHVDTISPDFTFARVSLALRWYNKNYVRTQFGGSLYSMTDPFFSLMLMHHLGSDYIVWDKHAEIDYLKPGKGRVYADFNLSPAEIETIKKATANNEKNLPVFYTEVYDAERQIIARIKRTLYIRRKKD